MTVKIMSDTFLKGANEKIKASKHKVGLREIAAAAQVSVATVSRVLNGNNRVDPAIQKIVLDATAKLDVDLSRQWQWKLFDPYFFHP